MSPLTDGCYLDYKHFDTEEEPGMHKVTTVADSYNYSDKTRDDKRARKCARRTGNIGLK